MDNKNLTKENKRVELATSTSVTTTYAGQFAGLYISAALKEGVTLGNNLVSINQNIKHKWVVKRGGVVGALADATCDFTPTGSIALTERILEPKELQQNVLLCKKDFRSDWEAEAMGFSAFDKMPPKFEDWLIAQMLGELTQSIENNIWKGNSTNTGEFDGFKKLLTADATVIDVDNTGVAPTSANVISVFLAPLAAQINPVLRAKGDYRIRVASDIYYAYIDALGGFGANGLGAAGYEAKGAMWYAGQPLFYNGIPVDLALGMTAGEAVAAQTSNLWFGTGVMNDTNVVKVIDTSEILGDDNVRYISRFTAGVQYGIGAEIVYLWNVTP
jgi:hypothetical protein